MNYIVIKDMKDLPVFNPEIPAFCDVETYGFYINLRLIQIYQPELIDKVYNIDIDFVDVKDVLEVLKPLWTIWQGCTYDFGTLNMTTVRFDDTLLLARSAYPQWREFKLDQICDRLGLDYLYEGLDKAVLQKAGFMPGAILSGRQLRYASADVIALSLIWKDEGIQKARKLLSYIFDILSIKYSIQYQQNGLIVDQVAVEQEKLKLVDDIEANSKILNGLNSNSPKQVCAYLGTDGSSKEILIGLISKGGEKGLMAQTVFNQRRRLKRKTFLKTYSFPLVLTRFNPSGAATGRFTSTGKDLPNGINAQQITRDLQYMFNKDTEDTVVVHADYSTAELRAACSIMKDHKMYEELKEGFDLHKIAATLAIGGRPEDVTKADRQKGKSVSFGLIFGMSAASFVEFAFVNYNVIFTLVEAQALKAAYVKRYPGIALYHKQKWNNYKTTPVVTPLGRRNMARLGTDAINFSTQGCIAETTKLAVHYLCKDYPEVTAYIYNIVHDAVYLRVPKGEEKKWAKLLVEFMKMGWTEMCKRPMLYFKDIPMPCEIEYNDYSSGEAIYKCEEF